MSVTVRGRDPIPGSDSTPPGLRRTVGILLVGVALAAFATFRSTPTLNRTENTSVPVEDVGLQSGRWVAVGTHDTDPFGARRIDDHYVYVTHDGRGVERIGVDGGIDRVTFGSAVQLTRLTSDGTTAVVYGTDRRRPAIWISTDGLRWTRRILPWDGAVQAVAIRPDGLVVLGHDRTRNRQLTAVEFRSGWAVQESEAPPTGLWSTGRGIVGRDRLEDGTPGYVHSTDGRRWTTIGTQLSLHTGDVATIHGEGREQVLRLPETGQVIHVPEWPVAALWDLGDRLWIQTPTAVWWSTDGMRWSPLRLSPGLETPYGVPVLLPFADRALISVGGARGSERRLMAWILGP